MRRVLFVMCLLTVAAPASSARQKALEFRTGDAFHGPVRSARIEQATFSREGGRLVEGARRPLVAVSYTPDGKRRDYRSFAPDGTLRERFVEVYDDAGSLVEKSKFDGRGDLLDRVVYRGGEGEVLTFNADGSLRERVVRVWDASPVRRIAEVQTFDARGALVRRDVNTREGGESVWKSYAPDGSLRRQVVHSRGPESPHRSEEQNFAPDGSVTSRRVSKSDEGAHDLGAVEERGDGAPPRRTRERREYDERGNLSRVTSFKWNAEAGEYEPTAVSYYTLTYYR